MQALVESGLSLPDVHSICSDMKGVILSENGKLEVT